MAKRFLIALTVFFVSFSSVFAADEQDVSAEPDKTIVDRLDFGETSFFGKINNSVVTTTEKLENWRESKAVKFKESLVRVDEKRVAEDGAKFGQKIFIWFEIVFLGVLVFVFSVQIVFYVIAILLTLAILRRIYRLIVGRIRD